MRHILSDATALLRDRRSIQPERMSTRPVHREILELALTNATWAPSHGMTQPWRFVVYHGEGAQRIGAQLPLWYVAHAGEQASERKRLQLEQRAARLQALVVVAVVPDPAGLIALADDRLATACAVQNLHLTLTAQGVGGFWSTPGFMHLPAVREFAGLPDDAEVLGLFYVGYPEGEWPVGVHRRPLEYVTTWIDR
jgi:nitroreductase